MPLASTTVVIKPWTGGIPRTDDGKFVTASIPQIADRIGQGLRRLPKLLRIQVRLLSMHKSGRVVSNGPSAPPSPCKELMLSTEVCTYLWAVAEAAMAQDAGSPVQPQRPHSRGSSPRRSEDPRRAPEDMAGPAADADQGAEAAPAAEAARVAEAAQAVVP